MPRQALIIRYWFLALCVALLGLWEPALWFGVVPLFFFPGCACCPSCEHCDTGTEPSQFQVTFSGVTQPAGAPACCLDFNTTTFVLDPAPSVDICRWRVTHNCDGSAWVDFYWVSGTTWRVEVGAFSSTTFDKDLGVDPIDCQLSGEVFNVTGSGFTCARLFVFGFAGSTATVTAL